ncbi:MAG TPA: CocE/NonD family hydrolase [Bryobacteraceae bacterium]|nr:CocE/NonD family hydrolase [Bryobacteraceae bacterium]
MSRIFALVLCGASLLCATTPVPYAKLLHVRVAMRDHVRLEANVFHPVGNGRFPTVLLRTPYGKGADLPAGYQSFINRGYAVMMQDVRGRYASGGEFHIFNQEGPDGDDTLNWIAAQPWSDGSVGMIGGSYLGIAQWQVALLNNPHLKAIFPVVSGSDEYLDRFYSQGGAMKLGHRLLWMSQNLTPAGAAKPKFGDYIYHLPLRSIDRSATRRTLGFYQTILDHPTYDSFWKNLSVRQNLDRVHVPVFAVGGWYDNFAESDLEAFSALHKLNGRLDDRHRIMIGPWAHNMSTPFQGVSYGDDSSSPIRSYQIEWFDRWLKGAKDETQRFTPETWHAVRAEVDEAPVHIFVMGVNRWRDEPDWPLARARNTPLYLAAERAANGSSGAGVLEWRPERAHTADLASDSFVYDPRNPVPTLGGAVCCDPKIFPWGPMDQRPVEKRKDVLVYTSAPLKQDLEVTGPIRVVLYASTSAPDTDFTAKLVDVFPDGQARNLSDGILRLRYRAGLDKVEFAEEGKVYPLAIDAGVTSNVFLAGHSIRVEISSSNFPRYDRNPNTGRAFADDTVLKKAQQMIYHSRLYPSHIVLPVIPAPERVVRRLGPERLGPELTSASAARYGAKRSSAVLMKPAVIPAR